MFQKSYYKTNKYQFLTSKVKSVTIIKELKQNNHSVDLLIKNGPINIKLLKSAIMSFN